MLPRTSLGKKLIKLNKDIDDKAKAGKLQNKLV